MRLPRTTSGALPFHRESRSSDRVSRPMLETTSHRAPWQSLLPPLARMSPALAVLQGIVVSRCETVRPGSCSNRPTSHPATRLLFYTSRLRAQPTAPCRCHRMALHGTARFRPFHPFALPTPICRRATDKNGVPCSGFRRANTHRGSVLVPHPSSPLPYATRSSSPKTGGASHRQSTSGTTRWATSGAALLPALAPPTCPTGPPSHTRSG